MSLPRHDISRETHHFAHVAPLVNSLKWHHHICKTRTTTQWADVFRHCCKVVGLNSQTGAGTGVTVDVSLADASQNAEDTDCWKNDGKMGKMFLRLSSVPWGMGSGPGFSSGNDTGVFKRSRDLPQVVLSWQWDMPDMPLKLCIEPRTNWCTESASTEVQELEGSDETWVKCSNARWFSTKLLAKLWGACRVAPASWRPPSAWKIAIQFVRPGREIETRRCMALTRTSGGAEPSRLHLKKGGSQQKEVVENVGRWMTNEKESGTKWSHHHLRMIDEIRHVIFWIYPFWDFLYSFENAGVPIPASYPSLNISVIATLLVLLCFAYRFLLNPSCYTRYLRLLLRPKIRSIFGASKVDQRKPKHRATPHAKWRHNLLQLNMKSESHKCRFEIGPTSDPILTNQEGNREKRKNVGIPYPKNGWRVTCAPKKRSLAHLKPSRHMRSLAHLKRDHLRT